MLSKERIQELEEAVSFLERFAEEAEIDRENSKAAYTEKLRQMTVERYQNGK